MTNVSDGQSPAAVNEYRVYVFRLQNQVWEKSKDFRDANPDYKPRKPVVYVGSTRQRPRLSEIQKRLGVRLLMVDLEKGVCEFEESDFEEEDAEQAADGYLEY